MKEFGLSFYQDFIKGIRILLLCEGKHVIANLRNIREVSKNPPTLSLTDLQRDAHFKLVSESLIHELEPNVGHLFLTIIHTSCKGPFIEIKRTLF